MNIEIANRLVELRKKAGLSQEELAAKIGLSRQAVSKWERAEASPDTDNLICLAKLYGVSLDELLNSDESVEDIAREQKERQEEKDAPEKTENNREIHSTCPEGEIVVILDPLDDDGDDDADPDGAKATINGEETPCRREKNAVYVQPLAEGRRSQILKTVEGVVMGPLVLIATAFYLVCGLTLSEKIPYVWASWWTVYMLLLIVPPIFESARKRILGPITGSFVGISVAVYILLGFYLGLWAYAWPIFLSIPIWGAIAGSVDPLLHSLHNKKGYKVEIQ